MAASTNTRNIFARLIMLMMATILLFYAGLLISTTMGFYSRRPISILSLLFGLGPAVAFYMLVGRKNLRLSWPILLAGLASIVIFIIVSGLTGTMIYDLSADGRDYQQTAIIQLEAGWNPIQMRLLPEDSYLPMWLNHYPRGPWIAAANIYHLVGNIEASKIFTILLMTTVFLATLALLLKFSKIKVWEAALLVLLMAFNPVSITQSLNFYIDGQVAAVYTLILVLALMCIFWPDMLSLVGLAAAIVIALNIKFTATVYTLLLLTSLLLVGLVLRKSWRWALTVGAVAFIGIILGLIVVGYNPYFTNVTRDGHPFFPLYGSKQFNKDFVMRGQMPLNFEGQSWGKKLFLSIFSRSQNTIQGETGSLKLPFTFMIDEIKQFRASDVRVAGFGVLFGGAMLVAIVGMAILLSADRRIGLIILGLLMLVILTMLINPEAWWARYAPQLWLIPILVATGCLISKVNQMVIWSGRFLIIVLLLDITLIAGPYLGGNLRDTMRMKHIINQLAKSPEVVSIYYGPLRATTLKLDEAGIKYRTVFSLKDLPCPQTLSPMVYYSQPGCSVPP